ncbi:hypothetical protein PENTCL1PPCAC_3267 [Pristionchus entomophagus]|uniref:Uncharacterized protein n=1 Tax=Pristionchus entomophagus TaxID=358040 RepID=A0AAV5SES5_9BILA|nr:hypothetical protein PENTCL1PPCAC_3267 [Pristionchus entomophagus]
MNLIQYLFCILLCDRRNRLTHIDPIDSPEHQPDNSKKLFIMWFQSCDKFSSSRDLFDLKVAVLDIPATLHFPCSSSFMNSGKTTFPNSRTLASRI